MWCVYATMIPLYTGIWKKQNKNVCIHYLDRCKDNDRRKSYHFKIISWPILIVLDPLPSLRRYSITFHFVMMHGTNALICGHVTRPSPFVFVTKQKLYNFLFPTLTFIFSYCVLPSLLVVLPPKLPSYDFAAISSSAVRKDHRSTQSWAQIRTAVILVLAEVRLRNRSPDKTFLVSRTFSQRIR